MCEWLSSGEWCDVQLVCGGRAFSAHRTVLASVSEFLRSLLLTCSTEDSPILIYLPEFDMEVMSSVLYYIYNGEVVISKPKLKTFLDIVEAMQIFIDYQYLPTDYGDFENAYNPNINIESAMSRNIDHPLDFTPSAKKCANIKEGTNVRITCKVKQTLSSLNVDDTRLRQRCAEQYYRTLEMRRETRQSSTFVNDLLIETYDQNGNNNGRPAGVLAISNECYRGPTSLLLANANASHPITSDIVSHTSEKASLESPQFSRDKRSLKDNSFADYLKPKIRFSELDWSRNFCTNWPLSFQNYPTRMQSNNVSGTALLNIKLKQPSAENMTEYPNTSLSSNLSGKDFRQSQSKDTRMLNMTINSHKNIFMKSCILNKVLQNPWCSLVPNNYKPFRRKQKTGMLQQNQLLENNATKLRENCTNDSNNNKKPNLIVTDEYKSVINYSNGDESTYSISKKENADADEKRHPTTRYTCTECNKTFSQLRNYKYHMSVHRGTKEFATTCPVCGKYFNDRGYLSSHMKIHRNRKEYKCSLCPKSFNQRVAYNMHVRIHSGLKPHVCDDCGKAFSRKMLLKQHQRTHSGERPYACPHCDRRFADRSNMTLHLRLHTGIKPFSCSMCSKSFTKKHHLKSHLNFHTGAKPYSCPRCKLAFTQSSNMRTHLKKCSAPLSSTFTDKKNH